MPPSELPAKPVSPRKVAANRANARRSTGPRTPEGKARSALNASLHALTRWQVVLPRESRTEFDSFAAALRADLRPGNFVQAVLVERIVELAWKLRRAGEAQVRYARDAAATIGAIRDLTGNAEYMRDRPVSGARMVAEAAVGAEQGSQAYFRLDGYGDRLQRAMLSALFRLRQEQRLESANEEISDLLEPDIDGTAEKISEPTAAPLPGAEASNTNILDTAICAAAAEAAADAAPPEKCKNEPTAAPGAARESGSGDAVAGP